MENINFDELQASKTNQKKIKYLSNDEAVAKVTGHERNRMIEVAMDTIEALDKLILTTDNKRNSRLVITGSLALALHGVHGILPFKVEIKDKNLYAVVMDLDLIIQTSRLLPEDDRMLKGLQAANPTSKSSIGAEGLEAAYRFMFMSHPIDVFIEDFNDLESKHAYSGVYTMHQGLYINPVHKIIRAKKKLGRVKDHRHIMDMAAAILK